MAAYTMCSLNENGVKNHLLTFDEDKDFYDYITFMVDNGFGFTYQAYKRMIVPPTSEWQSAHTDYMRKRREVESDGNETQS